MGKPKVRPPSQVDSLTFPVFGLTWHGAPSSQKGDGYSAIAYCGGGGSAKTGVGNKIVVLVAADGHSDDHPDNAPSVSRQVEISTGEALCFGVYAFRPYGDRLGMVRLLACVGDEILLYGISLTRQQIGDSDDDDDDAMEEATLLARTSVGRGYGANVSTYSARHLDGTMIHSIAVGCENGKVVVFRLADTAVRTKFELEKTSYECEGHTKAVCAVSFHPRGHQILSSAKDGTARIFCARTGAELGLLRCEVHNPNGPAPPKQQQPAAATGKTTTDPRFMKRPPQILVRGSAYGDLEGNIVYTIASGKRGAAYLTKWRTLVPLNNVRSAGAGGAGPPPPSFPKGGGGGAAPPSTTSSSAPPPPPSEPPAALEIKQEYRIQCSPVPISATSLSSDGTLFALGSVEGSILLYNLETNRVTKEFREMHDLPVTCVAARPVPNILSLPGEAEGGVNFDAVSASADNRLGRWTLQKKSRVAAQPSSAPGTARRRGALETYLLEILRVPLYLFALLVIVAVRDTAEVCSEEFGLGALVMESGVSIAGRCLLREVLWAEEGRVSFVPE